MYIVVAWSHDPTRLRCGVSHLFEDRKEAHTRARALAPAYDAVHVIELRMEGVALIERHTPDRFEDLAQASKPAYDAQFDDEICQCGHSYVQHFDTYTGANLGCLGCDCSGFRWAVLSGALPGYGG